MTDRVDQNPRYLASVDMSGWEEAVSRFFSSFVFNRVLPNGAIVELGTAHGRSFAHLCRQYGEERCLGFDVVNYSEHPRIRTRDVRAFLDEDHGPAALVFNDLSDWTTSPVSKRAGLAYAVQNLVPGGLYIDAAYDTRGLAHANRALSGFRLITQDGMFALFERISPSRSMAAHHPFLQQGCSPLSADIDLDFAKTPFGAAVLAAYALRDPEGASLAEAFVSSPYAPSIIQTRQTHKWLRLNEQVRSLTVDIAPLGGLTPGTLVVKGAEPAMSDYSALIDWMASTSFRSATNMGHRPMLEHFPLREGKVPGAVTLNEAKKDADAAMGLQALYLARYGELPRVPVPVAVLRHSETTTNRVREILRARLTPSAFTIANEKLEDGLGIFVYLYPGFPVRVRNFSASLPGETEMDRIRRMGSVDIASTIADWSRLLLRMFALDVLPYSYQNEGLGACFDAGNACVDGGFVDLDSIVPRSDLRDDGEVLDAVVAAKLGMIRTASHLFPVLNEGETRGTLIERFVTRSLELAADEERKRGPLDPRVEAVLGSPNFEELWAWLQARKWQGGAFFES